MATYVLGHKIPDTDSICSAISLSYLKNQIGEDTVAVRQGEINPETAFVLSKFKIEQPELKTSFANEKVYITDHSDKSQSPDDLSDAEILGIVDHHKLGDITTSAPLECWIRPVGCTNTIIKEMFDYHKVQIPKNIASIMLCAILSDTIVFKSPTCTKFDIEAVEELAKIAEIADYKALGIEMFKVKSKVDGTPIRDLVLRDFKDFSMNGKKVGIAQLEVIDLSLLDAIKDQLHEDIKIFKQEGNRDSMFLVLTDIMKEGSELLIASDDESIVPKAFGQTPINDRVWLDGVLSRKKQVVPFLEKAFA